MTTGTWDVAAAQLESTGTCREATKMARTTADGRMCSSIRSNTNVEMICMTCLIDQYLETGGIIDPRAAGVVVDELNAGVQHEAPQEVGCPEDVVVRRVR
jgi:hypothetical protein